MKASRAKTALPIPVRRFLVKLGGDLSSARRRRRMPTGLMAERAMISRNTLLRVEKGDPSVSMSIYATVLFVLGMADRLGALADPATDRVGLALGDAALPTRIRKAGVRPDGP